LEALARRARQKQHEWEPGKPTHQRRAAIAPLPDHERRLDDEPTQIERLERGIGLGFRPRIRVFDVRLGAHGGYMHEPLDVGGGASLEQGDGRGGVDAVSIVTQAVLQDAHAIYDGVDAPQARQPLRHRDIGVEVAGDPFNLGVDAVRQIEIAPRPDDADAVAPQRRDDPAADEAVGPGHEAAHAREPFRSTCSGGG